MSKDHEQKFWGANRTAAQRIARVPDLSEPEVRYALALGPDGALLAALEARQDEFVQQRARRNSMGILLKAPAVDRIRYAAGLLLTCPTNYQGNIRARLDVLCKQAEELATELETALNHAGEKS